MKHRILGKTNLEVSELSLGGLFISQAGGQFPEAQKATLRALELGVNYIDTAPAYLNSEEVLGKILEKVKTPVIISTKLGGRPQPFLPQDKDCLKTSVEQSLKLLNRDHIDILMIHEPDRPRQYDWWNDYDHYYGPVIEVLEELKDQRIISFTGLGGTTAYEMANVIRMGRFDVVLTAFNYSLLFREARQEVLPEAKKQNMGIIIGSPLQQGAFARRHDEQVKNGARWLSPPRRRQFLELYRLVDECGIPLPELALRFVISNSDISCVLMGARSAEEVEQNCAAVAQGPLHGDILARLDEIAAMVPFRPFDEPFGLPFHYDYKGPGLPR